jgi:TonB family protein
MSSRCTLLLALTLALLVPTAFANKKDAEARAMIEHAKQVSDIRSEGAPAFKLRLSFKITAKDEALEGEYTEVWVSRAQWRKDTVAGKFRRTEVVMGRKRWLLDSPTAIPERLEAATGFSGFGRLQPEGWKPQKIDVRNQNGLSLRCIETGKSSLCFDVTSGTFAYEIEERAVGTTAKVEACSHSDYQKFGDRLVARSFVCTEGNVTTIEAKVIELAMNPAPDQGLFVPAEGAKESVNCFGHVLPPKPIRPAGPDPPQDRRGASAVVSLVVGTNGFPRDLSVSGPDQEFNRAALEAVRQWTFKPAMCDGEPVETEIVVQLNSQII